MRAPLIVIGVLVLILVGLFIWGIGVNNQLVQVEQGVNEKWAQVQNVYQRRADLIPNLVETVKGFAAQERTVLEEVIKARASATQIKVTPELLNDPAALQKFQQAQGELSGALSRLLVTVERYPELKSNQNFLALQSQLEGTENRIAVERRRYNEAVREYNTRLRLFPGSLVASPARLSGEGLLRGGAGQRDAAEGEVLTRVPRGTDWPAVRLSRILAAAFLLLVLAAAVATADLRIPPAPDRRINDYAVVLTPTQRDRLEQQLVERERGSGNQVVVAIFRSLDGESLEDFSIRLAQAWRIGRKASTTA